MCAPEATGTPAAESKPETVEHTLDQWEKEIAEAEQRGYLRGRNEAVEYSLKAPGLYGNLSGKPADDLPVDQPDTSSAFLTHLRPSVWDL